MLKLTKRMIEKAKKRLEREKKEVEGQIVNLSKEDPFMQDDRSYNRELAQDASDTAGHERIVALKVELTKYRDNILKALSKVGIGTYGKCESCKKSIDSERLKIMPMATLCLNCEKLREQR